MSAFIEYLVDIAVTIFTYLSEHVQGDPVTLYMAYGFCLISILIVFVTIFSLIPKMMMWVYNLFRRSAE